MATATERRPLPGKGPPRIRLPGFRHFLTALSKTSTIHRVVTRSAFFRPIVNRFIAGETLPIALDVVRDLNAHGLLAMIDHLGEATTDEDGARVAAEDYRSVVTAIARIGLQSGVAVKLSQLGLDISPDLAEDLLRAVAASALEARTFVWVDMEDSARLPATQRVFDRVWDLGARNIGIALQAYLYRTPADAERYAARGVSIRLCKGAYAEPPDVAYLRKADVDGAFLQIIENLLGRQHFLAIATHDERLITHARTLAVARGLRPEQFEFQMLYGIRRDLQEKLAQEGYRMRVYVPFGSHWYPYFMRRLAERPANLLFFAKHLIRE